MPPDTNPATSPFAGIASAHQHRLDRAGALHPCHILHLRHDAIGDLRFAEKKAGNCHHQNQHGCQRKQGVQGQRCALAGSAMLQPGIAGGSHHVPQTVERDGFTRRQWRHYR